MAYIVTNVDGYRQWAKGGLVVNQITGEPRTFETKHDAETFCTLSHYRGATIIHTERRH